MASNLRLSDHALQRMAQRNISASDIDLILAIGSEVEGGVLVRNKDCQALVNDLKNFIQRIQRLKGKRLVIGDGCVVTAYQANQSEEQRLLRRGRSGRSGYTTGYTTC